MRRWIVAALALVVAAAAVVVAVDDEREPSPSRPATLADYWRGDARWTLAHKWTGEALGEDRPYGAIHMEIVGARWYLFNRRVYPDACASGLTKMGVQVRESRDRGATWSAPVPVIEPVPGAEWACAATDGDAVYDPESRTWRYLFQCLDDSTQDDDGDWNGCYAERRDPSPIGPYSIPEGTANPVIRAGDLWGEICDRGDECAEPGGAHAVEDEGTFNIFGAEGGEYWIGFHGFDGVRGYRGIAKTTSFTRGSFETDDPAEGLPGDAILGPSDARSFRERWIGDNPVGAGAGTIVSEDGYLYALNEFADVNLNCTDGQNWNLGIFRSPSPSSTDWEPFPAGNPIVLSSRAAEANGQPRGCSVTYPTLFQDPETRAWFMMHGRHTSDPTNDAIYVYRLEEDHNLLVNGDFWRGDTASWSRTNGTATNLAVIRDPNGSPDGTPYLALNCGASACAPEASAYQDVGVTGDSDGRDFAFGGVLRAEGEGGSLTLALHQIGARGDVIHTDAVEVGAGDPYAMHQGTGTLRPGVRRVRFELYPRSPQTFLADNLFVRIEGQ